MAGAAAAVAAISREAVKAIASLVRDLARPILAIVPSAPRADGMIRPLPSNFLLPPDG